MRIHRSGSYSQNTSNDWPWLSSSTHASPTSADSPGTCDSATSSTIQRLDRTCTSSPTAGSRSGSTTGATPLTHALILYKRLLDVRSTLGIHNTSSAVGHPTTIGLSLTTYWAGGVKPGEVHITSVIGE